MKILERYVAGGFLLIFGVAVAVFSFVMGIGSIVRAIEMVARGVSAPALAKFFLLNVPFILQYTIPMSVMTATLLLFTRLSMDGEITAMKACGMSLWKIVSPVVLGAILIAVAAAAIGGWISPRSRMAQRAVLAEFLEGDPLALLEPGRWIREFPNLMIFIGGRTGDGMTDIVIYEHEDGVVKSSVRARRGSVRRAEASDSLMIDLYDVRMEQPDRSDPSNPAKTRVVVADYYPQEFDASVLRRKPRVRPKPTDMTIPQLMEVVVGKVEGAGWTPGPLPIDEERKERSRYFVEWNSRFAMACSCFAMPLLGIPLGMRSHRRESSVGVMVSLLVIFCFYFFIMIAKALAERPDVHPGLIVWIPVIAAQLVGLRLILKSR